MKKQKDDIDIEFGKDKNGFTGMIHGKTAPVLLSLFLLLAAVLVVIAIYQEPKETKLKIPATPNCDKNITIYITNTKLKKIECSATDKLAMKGIQ